MAVGFSSVIKNLYRIVLITLFLSGCNSSGSGNSSGGGDDSVSEPFSVAISVEGAGYLIINDQGATGYTRSAHFLLDDNGFLYTGDNLRLQGEPAINNRLNIGVMTDIRIDSLGEEILITIKSDGTVLSVHGAEQTVHGRILLARFYSPLRLNEIEPGFWGESNESGQPIVSTPGGGAFKLLSINESIDTQLNATLELSVADASVVDANYFVLTDGEQTFYSQQQVFFSDKQGRVINEGDLQLIAYNRPAAPPLTTYPDYHYNYDEFDIVGLPGPLWFEHHPIIPNMTTRVYLEINLRADDPKTVATAFDSTNENSYHFSASTLVLDSLGYAHTLEFFFVKLDTDNEWELYYLFDNDQQGGEYPVTFDELGNPTPASLKFDSQILYVVSGAMLFQVEIDASAVTLQSDDYLVNDIHANGHPVQRVSQTSVNRCGEFIINTAPSDINIVKAYLAVAKFDFPEALSHLGNGIYSQTVASGEPQLGVPCRDGFEAIIGDSMD
jgi:flagellar hook protein FlgE